jgi:hypothetical protein
VVNGPTLFRRPVAILCAVLLPLLPMSCDDGTKRSDTDTAIVQPQSDAVCVAAQLDVLPGPVEGWRTLGPAPGQWPLVFHRRPAYTPTLLLF